MKHIKNENRQKHVILVNLRLWEHQNRIRHVHKPLHAKYEFRSCRERRVMTILRKKTSTIRYNQIKNFKNCIKSYKKLQQSYIIK